MKKFNEIGKGKKLLALIISVSIIEFTWYISKYGNPLDKDPNNSFSVLFHGILLTRVVETNRSCQ